jgi:hypothetical protein
MCKEEKEGGRKKGNTSNIERMLFKILTIKAQRERKRDEYNKHIYDIDRAREGIEKERKPYCVNDKDLYLLFIFLAFYFSLSLTFPSFHNHQHTMEK